MLGFSFFIIEFLSKILYNYVVKIFEGGLIMRTELVLSHARSMNNGIIFYSNRHKGYGAIATIDENGNIKTEWTTVEEYEEKNEIYQEKSKYILKIVLLFLPCAILFSLLDTFLLLTGIFLISFIRIFLVEIFLTALFAFIASIYIDRKIEKNTYKFHSAEHMVINAYEQARRVVSIKKIHKYSRFHNYCGTTSMTLLFLYIILIFICSFIPNLFLQIIFMIFGIKILFVLKNHGYLNFLQKFTTIPPTDKELLVAIAGLRMWIKNEKSIKKTPSP